MRRPPLLANLLLRVEHRKSQTRRRESINSLVLFDLDDGPPDSRITVAMGFLSIFSAIPRQWRTPRSIYVLFSIELALSVAALALYGIAQPDLYRSRLWQEGSDHGWASNPNEIVYAYANYKPISVPLVWSQL